MSHVHTGLRVMTELPDESWHTACCTMSARTGSASHCCSYHELLGCALSAAVMWWAQISAVYNMRVIASSEQRLPRRPVALVVFIDSNFCYIKSGVGMDQYAPTERHMSFCTWTLVPVNPEMLVRYALLSREL